LGPTGNKDVEENKGAVMVPSPLSFAPFSLPKTREENQMLTVRKTKAIRADQREIENKNGEDTIYLYGDIGGWFGIDHLEFVKEFNALEADTIHLRVDSGGGDIFAARTIKTAIMQHKANVIAHVDGLAASAASFLIMGANEIEIVDGGFLMIHNASSLLDILGFFNIDDLNSLIDDLSKERNLHTKINETIANDYVKRTGKNLETILQWMTAETWFTSKEALENEFVDRVYDGKPTKGNYDLSVFNNVPEELKLRNQSVQPTEESPKKPTIKDLEKALRDVGCSQKKAKTILAKGLEGYQRDVDEPENPEPEAEKVQRDAESATQRDVEKPKPKKDQTAELLTRAEVVTPAKPKAKDKVAELLLKADLLNM